jgi:hypothetical protein
MKRILLVSLFLSGCGQRSDTPPPGSPRDSMGSPPIVAAAAPSAPIIVATDLPDVPTRVLDPRADEILRAMSTLLASTPRFAFEAEETFDEIATGGPRILLTNVRRVAVQRPNRFAADAEGDSLSRSIWFDGRAMSALDKTTLTYATAAAPATIDAALDMLSDKYGVNVPLADLLYADPYAVLTERVTFSKYLGMHRVGDLPAHHLVFAQPTIEWQIWIDAGETPLPRKMAITYVREPGEPQYVATIGQWQLKPVFPEGLFSFEPPDGATRVDANALAPRKPGDVR